MSSKPTLRRHFKAQRHLGEAATRSIQDAVAALIDQSNCGSRHVGIYWPLPGEVDVRPLRDGPHPPLALPVADGNGGSSTGAGVRTRFSPMAAAFPLLPQETL